MKRTVIYFLLLAAAVALRPESADIGKLRPVQLVSVHREDGQIVVETDTEDLGRGIDVDAAIRNLKETTPGVIYLDTADYLLVHEDTQTLIPQMANYLKRKVRVCIAESGIPLADASEYLAAHEPRNTIGDWESGDALESLQQEGEKIILKFPKKE